MTLRILHLLDHSIPLQSGYTFRTISILREQRALGWETHHITSPKHYATPLAEEEVDGWHFFRTPMSPHPLSKIPALREVRLMRHTERRLDEVVRAVRPDVIHAHSPVLNALPALKVGRRHGIPVVYEIRAFWEDAAVDHGTSREWGLRYRLTRGLETHAVRLAHHVFTICEGLQRDIVARGVSAHKVTVIPNAVDAASFRFGAAPDAELRSKLGLEGHTVIGFIGSFYAYEGLDLLISAVPLMLERFPDVRLLLVGGGPQEQALKALARSLSIADRVIFVGRVPHAEVQRYYSVVDLFAYPRHSMRLTELVTPLKPLEAMAQGQLLVASDVGGHRELIRDAVTGVLFRAGSARSLADAAMGLLEKRASWPALRANARNFVERERTWRGSVGRYQRVYEELCAAGAH